jgi:hypothetical protein
MYFAGSYTPKELEILAEYHCGIMQNWATVDPKDAIWDKLRTGEIDDVIFDSGGFQLQTGVETRRVVNLDNYALWLELTLRDYPNIKYMALDHLGDNPRSFENLNYLEDKGLRPIPIWHSRGSDVNDVYLDYYCNHYSYIALGGIAMGNRGSVYRLMEYLMQKYPKMNFHLLGIGLSVSTICKVYRPYSADASSWLSPARWGQEIIFDGRDIKLQGMTVEDRKAIRKNDDVRTLWSRKAIHAIKEFEKMVNCTEPTGDFQKQMFTDNGEEYADERS